MNFYIMSKDVVVAKWQDNNLEIINEKMKAQEHFLGTLKWMVLLIVCSCWLVFTTTILKLFLIIDVFGVIRSAEEETEM